MSPYTVVACYINSHQAAVVNSSTLTNIPSDLILLSAASISYGVGLNNNIHKT